MTRTLHRAVFTSEADLLAALRDCARLGLDVVEVQSPYPVHGVDELIGIRRTRLPAVCLAGGIVGLTIALWFQYWSSATNWPIDVGGKPWDSLPAFAPVAFETTILLAGLCTVFGLLFRSRLWPGSSTRGPVPGVTSDRFAVFVARRDGAVSEDEVAAVWRRHGGLSIERTLEEDA